MVRITALVAFAAAMGLLLAPTGLSESADDGDLDPESAPGASMCKLVASRNNCVGVNEDGCAVHLTAAGIGGCTYRW